MSQGSEEGKCSYCAFAKPLRRSEARGGLGIDSVSIRQEVSRSHRTDWETSCIEECGGLTGSGRAERQFVFEFNKEV